MLFLKINFKTTISLKRSRRELSINMVIDRFIFKNSQITVFSCFTFIPKTDMGLPKTGIIFYCVKMF